MKPTPGRIVHYRLTTGDCERILATRSGDLLGNRPSRGDLVPLLVVRVWDDEYKRNVENSSGVEDGHDPDRWEVPRSPYGINGQAFLDGNDSLWVTSAPEGDGNGFWHWPERLPEG